MNSSIFWYASSVSRSVSVSLSMIQVSRYVRDKTHYLCRGGIGGSCHCGGQSRSLVKGRPYVYKWAKESKHATCPAMECTDIRGWAIKEDVAIDGKKPKKIRTSLASRTCASWKTVTNQLEQTQ